MPNSLLAPAFVTGQRGFEELWFEPEVRGASTLEAPLRQRLAAFLGPCAAMWGYGPLLELVDD